MDDESSKKKKKSIKRELIEWAVFLSIIGTLYFSGLHVPVIGNLQRVLLWTGLMSPNTEVATEDIRSANYNLPLLTISEKQTSLNSFKGKTIFLNFWATWCPPCIAEMPNIQALYDEIDSDNIEFIMVSLDEDYSKAQKFIQKKNYTLPIYFLNGRKPGVYNSTVVPTTYVISPEGEIVLERRGMADYHSEKFKSFLEKL